MFSDFGFGISHFIFHKRIEYMILPKSDVFACCRDAVEWEGEGEGGRKG